MSTEFLLLLVVCISYISYLVYLNNQVINILNLKHTVIDKLLENEKNPNIKKSFLNLEFKNISENFISENKSFKYSIVLLSIIEGLIFAFCPTSFFISISIFIFVYMFSKYSMIKDFEKILNRLNSLIA